MRGFMGVTRLGLGGMLGLGAVLFGGLALVLSCATPSRPSGGPVDWIPPMVVSTWPDTFQVIEPTRKPVILEFNKRISERPTQGALNNAVIVSPAVPGHQVRHRRRGLEISIDGGLQPGQVYRIRVLPTIRDLFGNAMEGPFELVFSTGGEFEENVIAGVATDRITGDPMPNVRVEARDVEEGEEASAHLTFTDSVGVYVLRYVPSGSYNILLFEDINRNAIPDFREPQAETEGAVGLDPSRPADTLIQEVALLLPDTTPARLLRVQAEDSLLLRLTFDDYLDPEMEGVLADAQVRLSQEEEAGPRVARFLWQHQVDSLRAHADSVKAEAARAAEADSLRLVASSLRMELDSLRAEGEMAQADSVQAELEGIAARLAPPEPEPEPPPPTRVREPDPIRPRQFFFVLLEEPLPPEEVFDVEVTGVMNINALAGGGGEGTVSWTPPEPPPESRGPPPDTVGVPPPDTTVVPPPDTTAVLRFGARAMPPPDAGGPGPYRRLFRLSRPDP